MASELSEEKVKELAELLRQKFLQNHSGDPDVDSRDVARIQGSLNWISKFVRHQRGDLDDAYNHLMESLRWRKSFGLHDIQYNDIDENLWRSGMAVDHGKDRQGNQVVILHIRMHHKDAKKADMLYRWVAYSFEANQRLYPDHRICMIFDMAGAGISNIDMDMLKFIVNCFKIYFPDLLAFLLVYSMPWVLQAVWRIVQSWLSERAVGKVKFVTKESILTFIHPEQLVVELGGCDPWEYDFEVEKQRLLNQIAQLSPNEMNPTSEHPGNGFIPVIDDPNAPTPISEDPSVSVPGTDDPGPSVQDPAFVSLMSTGAEGHSVQEAGEEGSGDEGGAKGEGKKQVRFEQNIPPSRQTRFGPVDGEGEEGRRRAAFYSPDQRVLVKGTASDRGFRRRQVNKMLTKANFDRVHEEAHSVGGDLKYSSNHLIISPSHELVFAGKQNSEMLCSLTLTNTSENTLAYKVKTTAPTRYKVRPNLALIDKKSVAKVHVLLTHAPGDSLTSTSVAQDKFLIQSYVFDSSARIPEQRDLITFWKSLPRRSIVEHRMRCRLLYNVPKGPVSPKHEELKPQTVSSPHVKETVVFGSHFAGPGVEAQMSLMAGKVDKLVASSKQLSLRVRRLTRLNCAIVVLLILVLIFSLVY